MIQVNRIYLIFNRLVTKKFLVDTSDMKYINKILSLFVIALIATSCDPDAESYTLGELEDVNQGI